MIESAKIIKRLQSEGWVEVRCESSHHHFKHPDHTNIITVPHPRKDIKPGLRRAIEREAGWR
jgi:predicted RNA binding protein YcfA (HicA-like mRNA interferase family)